MVISSFWHLWAVSCVELVWPICSVAKFQLTANSLPWFMGGHDLRKVQQTTIRDEMDHYMSNFDTSSHHKILIFSLSLFLNGPWTWLNNVVCFSFDCWSVQLNGISLSFLVRCHFQQCWLPRWDPNTTGWKATTDETLNMKSTANLSSFLKVLFIRKSKVKSRADE